MRKIALLLLLTGCIQQDYPKYRTIQVNYQEQHKEKYLYLNVKQIDEVHFEVLSQEFTVGNAPSFVITEMFDYNCVD